MDSQTQFLMVQLIVEIIVKKLQVNSVSDFNKSFDEIYNHLCEKLK